MNGITATKDKRLNKCKKCRTSEYTWLYFQKYDPHWWVTCKKCGTKTSGIGCAKEESVIKEWNNINLITGNFDPNQISKELFYDW